MIVHCQGQLALGATPEELLDSWSDVRSAARRLRRTGTVTFAVESLPEKLQLLVNDVVRNTRLHRQETLDVTRELYEHFSDGLADGETVDDLSNSFGDVSQAARLVRRAKIRNRSWPYQLLRFGVRVSVATVAAAFLVWCFLSTRYFLSKPKVSRNYFAELDQQFVVIPTDDRAWPLYRQALIGLPDLPFLQGAPWKNAEELSDQVRQMLREHQGAISKLREASGYSRFGFSFRDPANQEWLRTDKRFTPEEIVKFQNPDGPVTTLLLPQMICGD